MKRMSLICMLLSSTACCYLASTSHADEPAVKKVERKYAKSFADEDLSKKSFVNQNLDNCNFENAELSDANFEGASLKNCNFRGANMKNTRFTKADLTGSDFQEATLQYTGFFMAVLNKVNFEGLDLSTIQLNELKMRGASFRNVKGVWNIYGGDFFEADLRGANFSKASDFNPATFRKARYDQFTRWHEGCDPKARGAVYEETKDEPVKPKENPKKDLAAMEAAFAKLDGNSDGVLSGKEMATCKDRDTNNDSEVTLAEFLSRK